MKKIKRRIEEEEDKNGGEKMKKIKRRREEEEDKIVERR